MAACQPIQQITYKQRIYTFLLIVILTLLIVDLSQTYQNQVRTRQIIQRNLKSFKLEGYEIKEQIEQLKVQNQLLQPLYQSLQRFLLQQTLKTEDCDIFTKIQNGFKNLFQQDNPEIKQQTQDMCREVTNIDRHTQEQGFSLYDILYKHQ